MKDISKRSLLLLLCVCMFSVGCKSSKYLGSDYTNKQKQMIIKPGDKVRLYYKSGEKKTILVKSVQEDGIHSEDGQFYSFDETGEILHNPIGVGKKIGIAAVSTLGCMMVTLVIGVLLVFAGA